jgi:DNA-directed RNA polymerase specialized sigma24 family protein
MSVAKQVAAHLPYLRRFARALSGSQQSGDAYVVSTLEALIADPSAFPEHMGARAGLYRVFLRLWTSVSFNGEHTPPDSTSPAQRNLNSLTPRSRQAFLLRTVEEFSVSDVAKIMDVEPDDIDELVATAGREIAQQVATSVLIIEDEPIIAMDIEALVRDLGHSVVGIARTHGEAVRMASETRPGLILADIQLADGSSGLEAVNEILRSFELPVIFITAYPERLLTGDRPEPAFLIAKPYQTETVRASISQALFFSRKSALTAA